EAFRRERPEEVELALAFSEWGIPTAEALIATHRAAPQLPLIASGGLKHGLDAAKAIAMGADLTGFAHAVLAAASEGEEPVRRLQPERAADRDGPVPPGAAQVGRPAGQTSSGQHRAAHL